eukprot:6341764-Amphidinium_carterae.1
MHRVSLVGRKLVRRGEASWILDSHLHSCHAELWSGSCVLLLVRASVHNAGLQHVQCLHGTPRLCLACQAAAGSFAELLEHYPMYKEAPRVDILLTRNRIVTEFCGWFCTVPLSSHSSSPLLPPHSSKRSGQVPEQDATNTVFGGQGITLRGIIVAAAKSGASLKTLNHVVPFHAWALVTFASECWNLQYGILRMWIETSNA